MSPVRFERAALRALLIGVVFFAVGSGVVPARNSAPDMSCAQMHTDTETKPR
jgi:hypothetical protein